MSTNRLALVNVQINHQNRDKYAHRLGRAIIVCERTADLVGFLNRTDRGVYLETFKRQNQARILSNEQLTSEENGWTVQADRMARAPRIIVLHNRRASLQLHKMTARTGA